MEIDRGAFYLPVLGLTLQHNRVLGLVNVIWVLFFDLLDVGLGLDALILGESALMALLHESVSSGRECIA
jgi:hypothetical protein